MVKPTRCINVSNLFYWISTAHVSDGFSVLHQELKTVHTATGICLLLYVQSLTPDEGRKNRPKHVEC